MTLQQTTERVVLVTDDCEPIGSADKATVHSTVTPLHLAFSCHVYNSAGDILITRRSIEKLTWPGVWTNSFCGHPAPHELMVEAINRRAYFELGITVASLTPLLPKFRYRAVDASGIVENEICPVFSAETIDTVLPNPHEIAEFAWIPPDRLRAAVTAAPFAFSPWLVMQLQQLASIR